MIEPLTDRTERVLRRAHRLAVPLPELARQVGASPGPLAEELERDDRFIVIPAAIIPDFTHLPAADRKAYGAALRAAGVQTAPSVTLARPVAPTADGELEVLLRGSVAGLLAVLPVPDMAEAAERARAALDEVRAAARDPSLTGVAEGDGRPPAPAETPPSTTPPPGPDEPVRAPPRRRIPSPARPPYPGARRG